MKNTGFYLIWPDDMASAETVSTEYVVYSPRAGGKYCIRRDPPIDVFPMDLDDDEKVRLTTLLVDLRNQGQEMPLVTLELIERARRARPLGVDERADRLLRFIGSQLKSVSDAVTLSWSGPTTATEMLAIAWSESTSDSDMFFLLHYLRSERWVEGSSNGYRLTVDGYRRLAEVKTNLDSAQGFVAMWFGDEMNDAYEKGIEPAILDAGYKPMRIDRKQDVVKIDDEIVAEIRRSRFLVADFTHGEDGARGGVYYEAGFAYGLGIPVIYTCREGSIDEVHFDTRQYHHTTWSSPEGLRTDLKNRILALIGEGPVRSNAAP